MGRLERKLDADKVAQVLAAGLTPHKRGRQPPIGAPLRPDMIVGRWPSAAYAAKRARKKARRGY